MWHNVSHISKTTNSAKRIRLRGGGGGGGGGGGSDFPTGLAVGERGKKG